MLGLKHWFVPERDVGDGFRVRGIGVRELMPPCIVDRPAGTGDYMLMFFYNESVLDMRHVEARATSESLRVWSPGTGQYYGNPDREWLHSWIHCNGAYAKRKLS